MYLLAHICPAHVYGGRDLTRLFVLRSRTRDLYRQSLTVPAPWSSAPGKGSSDLPSSMRQSLFVITVTPELRRFQPRTVSSRYRLESSRPISTSSRSLVGVPEHRRYCISTSLTHACRRPKSWRDEICCGSTATRWMHERCVFWTPPRWFCPCSAC